MNENRVGPRLQSKIKKETNNSLPMGGDDGPIKILTILSFGGIIFITK